LRAQHMHSCMPCVQTQAFTAPPTLPPLDPPPARARASLPDPSTATPLPCSVSSPPSQPPPLLPPCLPMPHHHAHPLNRRHPRPALWPAGHGCPPPLPQALQQPRCTLPRLPHRGPPPVFLVPAPCHSHQGAPQECPPLFDRTLRCVAKGRSGGGLERWDSAFWRGGGVGRVYF
jgi:hypothetical protein